MTLTDTCLRFDRRIYLLCTLALLSLGWAILIRVDVGGRVIFLLLSQALVWVGWLAACLGCGSLVGVPRSTPAVLSLVTRFGIGFGILSILVLLLGLLGWMQQWIAVGLLLVGLTVAITRIVRGQKALKSWLMGRANFAWMLLALAPFAGATILGACVLPGVLWRDEPHGYDVLSYHLQLPREWFELGKIAGFQHNVFSYAPLNVEMHYLLAMHLTGSPFGGMYLAQFMHATITLASAAVVYGALRERSLLAASIGALSCAAIPWTGMLGAVAYNDGGAMFFGALACTWAWRSTYGRNDSGWPDHVLSWTIAGASAGFAFGCKYPAFITVVLLPPILLIRKPFKPSIAGGLIYVLCALFVASPWLIRNYVWTSNPVFPLASNLFGKGHWDDGQIERFNVAHSPTENEKSIGGRLAKFESEVIVDKKRNHRNINERYGLLCMVLFVGLIGTAVRRDPMSVRLGLYLLSCAMAWISFTHLQGRFFAPMIPIICWFACLHANRVSLGVVGASILMGTFASPTLFARLTERVEARDPSTGKVSERFVYESEVFALDSMKELTEILLPLDAKSIPADKQLVFVGDAQVFWYDVPMRQLRYRTVFDVPSDARDLVEAYSRNALRGSILIVNESELARLSKTYRNLPVIPDEFRGDEIRVIVKP